MNYRNIDDSLLIKNYQSGDNSAIGMLFSKYHTLFLSSGKKYFCNRENAEDIVQDVLLRFLEYPNERRVSIFSKVYNVKSFIYTAIRNLALDSIRKNKIELTELSDIDMCQDESDDTCSLTIDYSIVGLSKNEMKYVQLFVDGVKLDGIAKVHNVSKNTVKNTIQNAKKKIVLYYKNNNYFEL